MKQFVKWIFVLFLILNFSTISFAETIIKIVKDIKHGGLVVKMIDGELEIREMAQLDQGTVLVIGDKKTETFFNSPEANLDVASLIQAVK